MAKWDNMLAIIRLLKGNKRMTAQKIAETLEISERTVYRYIDALCMSGVPVIAESGHEGGYCLPESFGDVPLFFDLEELKAINQTALFAEGAGYPFGYDMNRVLEKIQIHLNQEQLDYIYRHTRGFDVIAREESLAVDELLRELEQSVADCHTIVISYVKENDRVPLQRKVDAYGLFYQHENWYVVGLCHLRQDIRMFRVDRIEDFSDTKVSFKRPDGFSIRDYLQKDIEIKIVSDRPKMLVKIEGEANSLHSLEGHWYLKHCVVHKTVKQIHFLISEDAAIEYMPMLLMSYGTQIRLLEPVALKEKMIDKIQALNEHYK